MRYRVTPLGSSGGRSVSQVAADIVRYLDGPKKPSVEPQGQRPPGVAGPSRYYADGGDKPGQWLGNGAYEADLRGVVEANDFARVLAGRDPHTGARLITAQGSAGRASTVARGTLTRYGADGEPLYDVRDAATTLRLEPSEVERMVAVGESVAMGAFARFLGSPGAAPNPEFEGSYLVPAIDAAGNRWIPEAELQRCEAARAAGPDPALLAAAGRPDDLMPLAEAARLAGVTSRYLRSLCQKWDKNRERIELALAEGRVPPRPYLRAYRGVRGAWLVKRSDLVDYLEHRRPPAVRVGYDLTLTTEKSLGVLALLGDERTRAAVLGAIDAGNRRGLAHLEQNAAMARVRGVEVPTRGWTVASFRHLTSRALDPFPHHHNVVANTVVDPEGNRRALDARWLYRGAAEASALATAEMRHRLTADLGVRWRRGRKGSWEIDGIPDPVLRGFSRRSNEVDDAVAELEAQIGRTATIEELRGVITKTRPAKRQVQADDLFAEWWRRAEGLGFRPRHLARCIDAVRIPAPVPEPDDIFKRLAAPEGLCAGTSVFSRADVVAAIVAMDLPTSSGRPGPILLPADSVEELADEFLASDLVVELMPLEQRSIARYRGEAVFTTTEMLAVQSRVLSRFEAGRSIGIATVPAEAITNVLREHGELTAEQRHLVRAFSTSGDRVQCAIGRAGAGKTTAMRAAAAVWTAAGYKVLGTAVKGEAARHLGAEAGIASETLAWHLAHTDPASSPLDARTVLIVDEASTVSDRDLDRLLWLAEKTGAAVRLIGDPAQHGAVGAGGMFAVLCHSSPNTPELRISHRVTNPHDRAAADALRDGRIADALASLEAAGHLHVVTDEVDLYLDFLQRWWTARQAGDEHPMVDRRNHTRWQLNRLAHRLLQASGDVGAEEISAAGDRRFSVGDRVVARVGDRSLHPPEQPHNYVRNGAVGTVVAIKKRSNDRADAISVAFDGIGEVELPRSFFDEHARNNGRRDVGLDHAYAVTSYGVQGLTFPESTSRIDENASRSETYVDITRGRSANHLYLTRSVDPLDGEHLPRAPVPPIETSVGIRLTGSGPERAAVDVDPLAPVAAETRAGRDLAGLHGASDPGSRAAQQLKARQIARRGTRALDPSVLSKLPSRSHVPFLARQWDDTVANLCVFLARWAVMPGGDGPWEWALGPKTGDAKRDRERQRLARAIVDLTVASTAEGFRTAGNLLPEWAVAHLAHHAAQGRCVHDLEHLRSLYERVDAYRQAVGVDNLAKPKTAADVLLGAVPDNPVLRERRRVLSTEALPHAGTLARSGPVLAGP